MVAASKVKTNWLLLDDLEFWDEFTTKAINDPDTEDYFKQIDQAIDDKLAETIKWLDSDEAKEYFQQEAEYQEEVFEALEDEWDDILSGEIASADELLDRIYEHGKQQGYNDIRERIRYTDADRQALQFAKDYNFQLIQKLDDNLRDAVKNRVIQAVAIGEHPYELASKIQELGVQPLPGSTLSARHRAVMIARTETARVQNTGIIQSYVNEGFTEVNILTAEDSSVCRLCLANAYEFNTDEIILENRGADRTHKIADMNSNSWVPLHPNCRCTYVVVWDSRGEAPEKPQPVNLTPFHDISLINSDLVHYRKLQEKDIPSNLPKTLKRGMLELDKEIKGSNEELGYISNLTKQQNGTIVSSHKRREVDLNASEVEIEVGDVLAASHSHLSYNPFNHKDFDTFLSVKGNVYIKYMVVHTPGDVFIAEFSKESFGHKKEIIENVEKEFGEGMLSNGVSHNNIWNNYKNNKILNRYITFRRIRK